MSAAARPIAARFAGADSVGAAPASESTAATSTKSSHSDGFENRPCRSCDTSQYPTIRGTIRKSTRSSNSENHGLKNGPRKWRISAPRGSCVWFMASFLAMGFLLTALRSWKPKWVNLTFGKAQIGSAAFMALSHVMNDAQKTMGTIALTLLIATKTGAFDHVPPALEFLRTPEFKVASWIKVACALTMAAGTAMGGRRIIKTLGKRMVKMQPIHGFAAQTTAATVIFIASKLGMPISTTSPSMRATGGPRRRSLTAKLSKLQLRGAATC